MAKPGGRNRNRVAHRQRLPAKIASFSAFKPIAAYSMPNSSVAADNFCRGRDKNWSIATRPELWHSSGIMKLRLATGVVCLAGMWLLGGCSKPPETQKPVGPQSSSSQMPWNRPQPGEGQAQFGGMLQRR